MTKAIDRVAAEHRAWELSRHYLFRPYLVCEVEGRIRPRMWRVLTVKEYRRMRVIPAVVAYCNGFVISVEQALSPDEDYGPAGRKIYDEKWEGGGQ